MLIFQLLLIQIVTFAALVFVLRKLLFTEANSEVKRLKVLNEENEKKAEELRQKVAQAQAEYEEKLKKAEEDIRRLKEEAQKEIENRHNEAVQRAKEEAEKIITQARNSKEKMRQEIKLELEGQMVGCACDLVKVSFDERFYKNIHEELMASIIDGLNHIDENKISAQLEHAQVVSPFSLTPEQKQEIKKIISKKASRPMDIKEEADKELIAGAVIKLGNLIIDGSLANRLEEARQRMGKG
jgi:F0F1-type ATP synthase delta subunit